MTFDLFNQPAFHGSTYEPVFDQARLSLQIGRIEKLMLDGKWRTLSEIECELKEIYPDKHFPQASISAQLRNIRKGDVHDFEKQPRGNRLHGFDLSGFKINSRKDQIYRNCVHPETGLHIFNCALGKFSRMNEKQQLLNFDEAA